MHPFSTNSCAPAIGLSGSSTESVPAPCGPPDCATSVPPATRASTTATGTHTCAARRRPGTSRMMWLLDEFSPRFRRIAHRVLGRRDLPDGDDGEQLCESHVQQ